MCYKIQLHAHFLMLWILHISKVLLVYRLDPLLQTFARPIFCAISQFLYIPMNLPTKQWSIILLWIEIVYRLMNELSYTYDAI